MAPLSFGMRLRVAQPGPDGSVSPHPMRQYHLMPVGVACAQPDVAYDRRVRHQALQPHAKQPRALRENQAHIELWRGYQQEFRATTILITRPRPHNIYEGAKPPVAVKAQDIHMVLHDLGKETEQGGTASYRHIAVLLLDVEAAHYQGPEAGQGDIGQDTLEPALAALLVEDGHIIAERAPHGYAAAVLGVFGHGQDPAVRLHGLKLVPSVEALAMHAI